jgi:REP element-mobilizing transposase RayT
MARLARAVCGGELIHATTRGNNRRWVFHCDYDRRTLLSHLAIVVPRYEWTLYAWCLMGNH